MQNIQVLVVIVVALLAVLRSCEGLKCHQCDTYGSTKEEPQCIDPYAQFGEDNLDDCEDFDTHCVKMKTIATMVDTESGGLLGQVVVSRFCRSTPEKSNTCEYRTGAASLSITCYCNADGCNSGPINRLSFTFITMATFLTFLLTNFVLGSAS